MGGGVGSCAVRPSIRPHTPPRSAQCRLTAYLSSTAAAQTDSQSVPHCTVACAQVAAVDATDHTITAAPLSPPQRSARFLTVNGHAASSSHINGAMMEPDEHSERTSPSHGVFLQLLPLSPQRDVEDAAYDEMMNVPLLHPISPPHGSRGNGSTATAQHSHARTSQHIDTHANGNQTDNTAHVASTPHSTQLLSDFRASSTVSFSSAAGAAQSASVFSDKKRRTHDSLPTLSTMKRRRGTASRAVYAYKTSSVGSQYQARVPAWDANEAAQIQRERQQQAAPSNSGNSDGSAADVGGQPYFLSSMLPDTTAEQCQNQSSQTHTHTHRRSCRLLDTGRCMRKSLIACCAAL